MDFFGTVVKWVDGKGYGFIRLLPDGREVFCHSLVVSRAGLGIRLLAGQDVEVDIEKAADGRLRVARIRAALPADPVREKAFGRQLSTALGTAMARHGG